LKHLSDSEKWNYSLIVIKKSFGKKRKIFFHFKKLSYQSAFYLGQKSNEMLDTFYMTQAILSVQKNGH